MKNSKQKLFKKIRTAPKFVLMPDEKERENYGWLWWIFNKSSLYIKKWIVSAWNNYWGNETLIKHIKTIVGIYRKVLGIKISTCI